MTAEASAPMPEPVAEIIVREKERIVARWPLAPGEYRLGAAAENDLRLDFRGVSARHARIIVRGQEVLIEDLGSRFGTRRSGEAITGAVPLSVWRPAEIGDLRLEAVPLPPRVTSELPAATLPRDVGLVGHPPSAPVQVPVPANPAPTKTAPSPALWLFPALALLVALALAVFAGAQWRAARERAAAKRAEAALRNVQQQLLATRLAQQRQSETAPPPAAPAQAAGNLDDAFHGRLESFRQQPGWKSTRLRKLSAKSYALDLSELDTASLATLRGLPITELNLAHCDLTALPDLKGFALRRLVLTGTRVADLAPLRGQPLEELLIDETPVADLTSLANLPLRELSLRETPVRDLAPLGGLPLRALDLRDHSGLPDYRPLLACRFLEVLYAPVDADIYCLREHPALKLLAIRTPQSPEPRAVDGPLPADAFWRKYGDLLQQRAARKK